MQSAIQRVCVIAYTEVNNCTFLQIMSFEEPNEIEEYFIVAFAFDHLKILN